MASTGWQGEKTLYSWGSYSSLAFNLRIDSITHTGNTVNLTGALRLIYHNNAGGTGYYGFVITANPTGGSSVSYNTWSSQPDGYYQDRAISGSFTASSSSTSGAFKIPWSSSNNQNSGTASWTLTFDTAPVPPSGASVALTSRTYNSATITSSVSSWGSGYTGTPNLECIIVNPNATASTWTNSGRIGKRTATTGKTYTATVSNTSYDFSYDGGYTLKGAGSFKIAAYGSTSGGSTSVLDNTKYYTPPAPLASIVATQTEGVSTVSLAVRVTGADSTKNNYSTVTTYYRYTTNGATPSGSWTSLGTGLPWTSYNATISAPYGSTVKIQAKQTYQGLDSDIKEATISVAAAVNPTVTAPTVVSRSWNGARLTGEATSYGKPSAATGRYIAVGLSTSSTSIVLPGRQEAASNTSTITADVGNSSQATGVAVDFKGMMSVYPFTYANNTARSARTFGSSIVLPPAPGQFTYTDDGGSPTKTYTITFKGVAANNITGYTQADLKRYLRYKATGDDDWYVLINGLSVAIDTPSWFDKALGAGQTLTVEGWHEYKGQQSEVSTLVVTNNNDPVILYGGVNGEARQVQKLYGSVNGQTKEIKKLYASVNGVSKLIYEAL